MKRWTQLMTTSNPTPSPQSPTALLHLLIWSSLASQYVISTRYSSIKRVNINQIINYQSTGYTSNHQSSINMTYWLSCIPASAFLISTKKSIRYFWYFYNIQGAKIFSEKAGSSSKRWEFQKASSPPDWEFHEGAINVHTSCGPK